MRKSALEFPAPATRTELKNSGAHSSGKAATTFRGPRTGRLVRIELEKLPACVRDGIEPNLRWRLEHRPPQSSNECHRPAIVKHRAKWRLAGGRPRHPARQH